MRGHCKTTLASMCAGLLSAGLLFGPGNSATAAEALRILALGDSLTQGYGLPNGTEFPAQLEAALRAEGLNIGVINAGVSGDTSAGGLARLDWSLSDHPDAAIVELGGNDALRGLSPAEMEQNLDAILARLSQEGIPVLLAGIMSPRNMGPDYAAEFDAVYPRVAEKHGALFYPFFLDGVALDPDLMQADGTHANEDGVAEIVRRMMPLVRELIAKVETTQ
jgi:acyl-CoA thioesterase-1